MRFSRNGEFPLSAAASLTIHLFVILALVFGLLPKLTYDAKPPAVDVIPVMTDVSDIPGYQEPIAAEDALESQERQSQTPDESQPQPPRQEIQSLRDDPVAENQGDRIRQAREKSLQDMREAGRKASELAEGKRKELEEAKNRLNENIRSAASAGATGSQAGVQREGRLARWVLTLSGSSLDRRLAVLDRLGAEVAFPLGNQRWRFFSDLTGAVRTRDANLSKESRLYWGPSDDTLDDVHGLGRRLSVSDNSTMLLFLPSKVETELVTLERAFANRDEEDIASTVFAAKVTGASYKVEVAKQVAKSNH